MHLYPETLQPYCNPVQFKIVSEIEDFLETINYNLHHDDFNESLSESEAYVLEFNYPLVCQTYYKHLVYLLEDAGIHISEEQEVELITLYKIIKAVEDGMKADAAALEPVFSDDTDHIQALINLTSLTSDVWRKIPMAVEKVDSVFIEQLEETLLEVEEEEDPIAETFYNRLKLYRSFEKPYHPLVEQYLQDSGILGTDLVTVLEAFEHNLITEDTDKLGKLSFEIVLLSDTSVNSLMDSAAKVLERLSEDTSGTQYLNDYMSLEKLNGKLVELAAFL